MLKLRQIVFILLAPIVLFTLESLIKYFYIINKIPKAGFYFFNGLLQIGFFTNLNIAFGLPLPQAVIIILSVLILIFLGLIWSFNIYKSNFFNVFGLSLVILGALSNLLDRLIFGYVIDYINIFIWPVFNLADAMIVAGLIIYCINIYFINCDLLKKSNK